MPPPMISIFFGTLFSSSAPVESTMRGSCGRNGSFAACEPTAMMALAKRSFFTPIINAPEVAILGVSRAAMKPVWNGKEFAPRLIMPIALSYDHRVIDGATAARFTTYLVSVLSDIRKIIL